MPWVLFILVMPMKIILTAALLAFFTSYAAFAQECNCNKEFLYIKDKIELNYAGFNDKVNSKTEPAYRRHTEVVIEKSKLITKPAYCVSLINDWLKFFRDGHIQVGRNRISGAIEEQWLKKRIREIEQFNLAKEELAALKSTKGITGLYWDKDSTARIALVKNKNSFRDYAGIVISSKKGKWLPGQVILELKGGRDMLKGIYYDKYCIPNSISLEVKQHTLGSWTREGTARRNQTVETEAMVASKVLSAKTLYMKISTFNQSNASNIDSLFKANNSKLSNTPNLILDLRDNGGGADFAYGPIIPYLYTGPIRSIGADVRSTADNIAGWAAIATTDGLPQDQKVFINEVIRKMTDSKGEAVSFSEDHDITLDSIAPYPKKVIILINNNCGSTTEEFLLMAKQSSKVTLMGGHTAGVLDYSNMRGGEFSCMPYMLYWATSRSRRIDHGKAIDQVGIQPDQVLSYELDWVDEARRYAEK